jgi:hypothetical protein
MKPSLTRISEVVAKANDQFDTGHHSVDTVLGIIDKTLRKQGLNADAVSIDCIPLKKKIIFLLHDDIPDKVSITLGSKSGEIFSTSDCLLAEITVAKVQDLMEEFFVI